MSWKRFAISDSGFDDELFEINRGQIPKLKKMKKENSEYFDKLVKAGLVNLDDFKDEDSNDEKLNLRDKSISDFKLKG